MFKPKSRNLEEGWTPDEGKASLKERKAVSGDLECDEKWERQKP